MNTVEVQTELVVLGGGLAGVSAALAAARQGVDTILIQDRPVLGGNSSSEVRVTTHGAACFHDYARETGIIHELLVEERARNHEIVNENGWVNSVWDMVLYDAIESCPNLRLYLNTSVRTLRLDDGRPGDRFSALHKPPSFDKGYAHRPLVHEPPVRIRSVECVIANAETVLTIVAKEFVDCTGDGVVADLAGCEWRLGEESREEFGEAHAPAASSTMTMGNSIHIRCRDMGHPCPFTPPEWAVKHDDPSYFFEQGRVPHDPHGGFWWIEIGVPWHTITDNETIRHELTRHALGIWDWMKNKDPNMIEKTRNYALDFIGQVPGKRESRRIMGDQLLTEHDVTSNTAFFDEIAYGGWFVDLHTPGGLLAGSSEHSSAEGYNPISDYAAKSYCPPYGIPLGILIAKGISNLMVAGRNVSTTHAALGTVRVMATTALMGQAVGTTVAIAKKHACSIRDARNMHVTEIQQQLLEDDCFLPHVERDRSTDLATHAHISASSEDHFTGIEAKEPSIRNGRKVWGNPDAWYAKTLMSQRGVSLPTGGEAMNTLTVLLRNESEKEHTVAASLFILDHIWDYRVRPDQVIAEQELIVPPGEHWIEWPCALRPEVLPGPGRYLRLDLAPNEHIGWVPSGETRAPGVSAMFAMNGERMRRFVEGGYPSVRVSPAQSAYGAANVASGRSRPYEGTNQWKSDPQQKLPQWLALEWDTAKTIREVHLTFPTQLLSEVHAYPPFYRDPQAAKDYAIEVWLDEAWYPILTVKGNYQRIRQHRFEKAVSTPKLRIMISATNGDPSAAVYEVRVS